MEYLLALVVASVVVPPTSDAHPELEFTHVTGVKVAPDEHVLQVFQVRRVVR